MYLKSALTVGVFNISAFSMVLCLFSAHLMEIFLITHTFWKKILLSTASQWLCSLKQRLTQNLRRLTTT